MRLGMTRLEIGAQLELLRETGEWAGYANTFHEFLEDLRINSTAAYQWMRIARRLVGEMKLSEAELASVAMVNMRILDHAARVITYENRDEVLAAIVSLNERDARVALEAKEEEGTTPRKRISKRVRKMMDDYFELPDDMRHEFAQSIGLTLPALPRRAA